MIEFSNNEYIEINNPGKNNYIPIRILHKNEDGYNAILLPTSKEIKIYNYQLINYGYKKIWVSEKLLNQLGFKKVGFIYTLGNTIIWECIIGEMKNIIDPYYLYEYKSKFLGYAILKDNEVENFKKDYTKIDFNSTNHEIKEKYFFTSSISDIFNRLLDDGLENYNYKEFDKIILDNNQI